MSECVCVMCMCLRLPTYLCIHFVCLWYRCPRISSELHTEFRHRCVSLKFDHCYFRSRLLGASARTHSRTQTHARTAALHAHTHARTHTRAEDTCTSYKKRSRVYWVELPCHSVLYTTHLSPPKHYFVDKTHTLCIVITVMLMAHTLIYVIYVILCVWGGVCGCMYVCMYVCIQSNLPSRSPL